MSMITTKIQIESKQSPSEIEVYDYKLGLRDLDNEIITHDSRHQEVRWKPKSKKVPLKEALRLANS